MDLLRKRIRNYNVHLKVANLVILQFLALSGGVGAGIATIVVAAQERFGISSIDPSITAKEITYLTFQIVFGSLIVCTSLVYLVCSLASVWYKKFRFVRRISLTFLFSLILLPLIQLIFLYQNWSVSSRSTELFVNQCCMNKTDTTDKSFHGVIWKRLAT
ncbi:hypothetical protein ACOME3_005473 [Neoechinorhynchus agilis]